MERLGHGFGGLGLLGSRKTFRRTKGTFSLLRWNSKFSSTANQSCIQRHLKKELRRPSTIDQTQLIKALNQRPKRGGAVTERGSSPCICVNLLRVPRNKPFTCSKTGESQKSANVHLIHENYICNRRPRTIRVMTNLDKACAAEDACIHREPYQKKVRQASLHKTSQEIQQAQMGQMCSSGPTFRLDKPGNTHECSMYHRSLSFG
jgi:hypothetical protein